ncbi:MAG: ornithine carbamoyltransferase [Verrucomicrobia bacterium]|nr:MAG: ornithine carbamoyltransferase [Verrucomicrobiota bacterium]
MKHLLSLEKLARSDMERILADAVVFKKERNRHGKLPLAGQTWALIFNKSSTRTRVSFEVGIRELGGQVLFLTANDIQIGRGEPIKDTARVLGRMIHGAVIRTYAQRDVEEFAQYSGVPTVNALTDDEHPSQALSDIFTSQEKRGPIAKLEFELRIAAPEHYQPSREWFDRVTKATDRPCLLEGGSHRSNGRIVVTDDLRKAATGADLLYTDVWVSMGKEAEAAERIKALSGYQINRALVKLAKPNALIMHCLPAYRGKEIDEDTFEANAQTIFDQAENRLHAQKSILSWLVS